MLERMVTVSDALSELHRHKVSGRLADVCRRLGIGILVLHGSARSRASAAADVDLAYAPVTGSDPDHLDHLDVVEALSELIPGDHLDVMALCRADPVAAYAALGRGEPVFEAEPGLVAEQRIRAFGEYRDTQKFRDLALSLVGR